MGYSKEQVEEIAAKLRDMPKIEPPPKDLTKKEAVQKLAKEIRSLKAKGYSMEQIVNSLKGFGLEVSTPTLHSYLRDNAAKGKKSKKVTEQPRQEDSLNNPDTLVAANDSKSTPEKVAPVAKVAKGKFTPKADRLGG
jgi:SOS response regulatory protein OraA/RecX